MRKAAADLEFEEAGAPPRRDPPARGRRSRHPHDQRVAPRPVGQLDGGQAGHAQAGDAPRTRRKIYAQGSLLSSWARRRWWRRRRSRRSRAATSRSRSRAPSSRASTSSMSTRRCGPSPGAASGRRTGCSACSIFRQLAAGAQPDLRPALPRGCSSIRRPGAACRRSRCLPGAALKRGSTGKRVDLLRQRLGLSPGGGYDDEPVPGGLDLSERSMASAGLTASPARRRSRP